MVDRPDAYTERGNVLRVTLTAARMIMVSASAKPYHRWSTHDENEESHKGIARADAVDRA